ncbi:Uncharacterised protein [Serratia grimesii]|nr:Uncharacterised protein [Serratia grimesii]
MPINKNQENQFIDFRLITTKQEKPRFFLLCQQPNAAIMPRFGHSIIPLCVAVLLQSQHQTLTSHLSCFI